MSMSKKKLERLEHQEKLKTAEESDSEDYIARIDRMQEEIDNQLEKQKEYKMVVDKKKAKKDRKTKDLVELQRQKRQDVSDDELIANKELITKVTTENQEESESSENDNDLEEERLIHQMAKQ